MKYKDNNFYSYIFHVIILTALHFEALTFKYRHLNLLIKYELLHRGGHMKFCYIWQFS